MAQSLQISMLLSGSASSARPDKATSGSAVKGADNSFAATYGDLLSDNTATMQGGNTRQIPATVSNLSGISIAMLAKSDAEQPINSNDKATVSEDALAQMLAGEKPDGALSDEDALLAASLLRQINLLTPAKPAPADKTQPIITDPDTPTADTGRNELTEMMPLLTTEQDGADGALISKNTQLNAENVSVDGRLAGKGSKLSALTEQTKDRAVHQLTPEPQSQKLHDKTDVTLPVSDDVDTDATVLINSQLTATEQAELAENDALSEKTTNQTSSQQQGLLVQTAEQTDSLTTATKAANVETPTVSVETVLQHDLIQNEATPRTSDSGSISLTTANTSDDVVSIGADGDVENTQGSRQQSAVVLSDTETSLLAQSADVVDEKLTMSNVTEQKDQLQTEVAKGSMTAASNADRGAQQNASQQGQSNNGQNSRYDQQQAAAKGPSEQANTVQYGADDSINQRADNEEQPVAKLAAATSNNARTEQSFGQSLTAAQSNITAEARTNTLNSMAATTNAAEQLKQSLNLQHQDAAGQLRERVSLMVRQNIQVAEIRLDPAGLGQMQIKIDMQQDQATVQFIVQQHQAKEMLEQQLPRLREMLQQQGIQLADGQVQQQSQQQDRQLAQRDGSGGGNNNNARGNTGNSDTDELPMATQVTASVAERLVDYYA